MSFVSIGDMAHTYMSRRQNTQLKTTTQRLSVELASGKVADVAKRLSGDFTVISTIENALKTVRAYQNSAYEAAQFANSMQISLGVIQDHTAKAVSTLLLVENTASQTQITNAAADLNQKFNAVVSTLNTQVGGRSIFAGAATNGPAIASGADILADLQLAIAGQTTADDIHTTVDTWFAPGGGFDTSGYLGSTNDLSPFKLRSGQEAQINFTAAEPAMRDTLKGLALAALVFDGALAGNISEQALLLHHATTGLISISTAQTEMRANLGTAEAQIEQASVQSASEMAALEITKSELLGVDPYEAASQLEAVQIQLETLYATTARMSRLSLVDFLR